MHDAFTKMLKRWNLGNGKLASAVILKRLISINTFWFGRCDIHYADVDDDDSFSDSEGHYHDRHWGIPYGEEDDSEEEE